MLVLTRKLGELITIGSYITIKVLEIRGTQVKLGIQAPTNIPVLRNELIDRDNKDFKEGRF